MSETKPKDGGPAFPGKVPLQRARVDGSVFGGVHLVDHPGMTLRDWFAGQALAGMMAAPDMFYAKADKIAIGCYEMADAMMAAREQKP